MLTWRFQEQATTQVWTENKQCKHFLYKGTVEKLMCSSPKVALLPSIQHLLQKHAARHGTVLQHKDPKCTPMKVHERGMISSYKICIQRVKRKKHNKPADPWNHIPFKNMKKPHFGTVLRRKKPRFALCQAKDNTKNLPSFLDATRGPPWNLQIVYYFS